MDFQNIAQALGQTIVNDIAQNIYREIVWNNIIYAIKVGLFAGIVTAIIATILGIARLTTLDLTTYTGCMITSKPKGKAPLIAGVIFHLFMSAFFGVAYLYILYTFQIPGTLKYSIGLGIVHTLLSGSCMLLLDAINPCVANKSIARVGFAASAQGLNAFIAFLTIHVTFAILVVGLLAQ